ncbi:hypothetical protein [Tropicibacter oceani]|uniref:DUF2059 domain-containing protein n=1 Tax=Tropicibacter oceani TaxID=3058420 RepID=A0ABY8QMG4_9RHOB|nr:hypothetical protein [Tropicibacter oceani]WGW05196.1 hypothetical protein QF118_06540 [Tropicibacter oceani]
MKRLFATTALAATLATGAFAATSGQLNMLQSYLPTVDVDLLSEAQIDELLIIANGGASDTEKATQMQAVVTARNALNVEPLTPVEINKIRSVDANVDTSIFTDAEISELRLAIASGDRQAIERAIMTPTAEAGMVKPADFTQQEEVAILRFAPDADFSMIDAVESRQIRAALTSGDEDAIETAISAALAS